MVHPVRGAGVAHRAKTRGRCRPPRPALLAVLLPALVIGCAGQGPASSPTPASTPAPPSATPTPGPSPAYRLAIDWSADPQDEFDAMFGDFGVFYGLPSAVTTQAQPGDVVTVTVADKWTSEAAGDATQAALGCKLEHRWLSSPKFVPTIGDHLVTLPADFYGCATWGVYVALADPSIHSSPSGTGSWSATRATSAVVTAAPTVPITPTPAPTPTPRPLPQTDEEIVAACSGKPVPGAAPYAGKPHPLVVVSDDYVPWNSWTDLNGRWVAGTWGGPLQLVACITGTEVTLGSCGEYRNSSGERGELIVQGENDRIRIVAAATGKTVASKTFKDEDTASWDSRCGSYLMGNEFSGSPPWYILASGASSDEENAYLLAASTR